MKTIYTAQPDDVRDMIWDMVRNRSSFGQYGRGRTGPGTVIKSSMKGILIKAIRDANLPEPLSIDVGISGRIDFEGVYKITVGVTLRGERYSRPTFNMTAELEKTGRWDIDIHNWYEQNNQWLPVVAVSTLNLFDISSNDAFKMCVDSQLVAAPEEFKPKKRRKK